MAQLYCCQNFFFTPPCLMPTSFASVTNASSAYTNECTDAHIVDFQSAPKCFASGQYGQVTLARVSGETGAYTHVIKQIKNRTCYNYEVGMLTKLRSHQVVRDSNVVLPIALNPNKQKLIFRRLPYLLQDYWSEIPGLSPTVLAHAVWRDMHKALSSLHACGFAHCDIKPTNIVFRVNDHGPVVYLIDFGIASTVCMAHDDAKDVLPKDAVERLKTIQHRLDTFYHKEGGLDAVPGVVGYQHTSLLRHLIRALELSVLCNKERENEDAALYEDILVHIARVNYGITLSEANALPEQRIIENCLDTFMALTDNFFSSPHDRRLASQDMVALVMTVIYVLNEEHTFSSCIFPDVYGKMHIGLCNVYTWLYKSNNLEEGIVSEMMALAVRRAVKHDMWSPDYAQKHLAPLLAQMASEGAPVKWATRELDERPRKRVGVVKR